MSSDCFKLYQCSHENSLDSDNTVSCGVVLSWSTHFTKQSGKTDPSEIERTYKYKKTADSVLLSLLECATTITPPILATDDKADRRFNSFIPNGIPRPYF